MNGLRSLQRPHLGQEPQRPPLCTKQAVEDTKTANREQIQGGRRAALAARSTGTAVAGALLPEPLAAVRQEEGAGLQACRSGALQEWGPEAGPWEQLEGLLGRGDRGVARPR